MADFCPPLQCCLSLDKNKAVHNQRKYSGSSTPKQVSCFCHSMLFDFSDEIEVLTQKASLKNVPHQKATIQVRHKHLKNQISNAKLVLFQNHLAQVNLNVFEKIAQNLYLKSTSLVPPSKIFKKHLLFPCGGLPSASFRFTHHWKLSLSKIWQSAARCAEFSPGLPSIILWKSSSKKPTDCRRQHLQSWWSGVSLCPNTHSEHL